MIENCLKIVVLLVGLLLVHYVHLSISSFDGHYY